MRRLMAILALAMLASAMLTPLASAAPPAFPPPPNSSPSPLRRLEDALKLIDAVRDLALQGIPVPPGVRRVINSFNFHRGLLKEESIEFQEYIDKVIMVVGPWVSQYRCILQPILFPNIIFDPSWSLVPGWRWDIRRN